MPPRLRHAEGALYDYRPLIFSHIEIAPGIQPVLLADPWAYARAFLAQEVQGRNASPTKTKLERASYYVRQAEGFYLAGHSAQIRAKGVLLYYGMLNLVKAFLSISGVELETVQEHHGLTVPLQDSESLEVNSLAGQGNVHIFHEFAQKLGTPVTQKQRIGFLEVCAHIPELHAIMQTLELLPGAPHLLPTRISFCVNDRHDRFFTEVSYPKRHEKLFPTRKFLRGERAAYFKPGAVRGDRIVHQSKRLREFSKQKCPDVYRHTLRKYRDFSIVPILTRTGYRHYCDLSDPPFHHLCYTLAAMFFIGSISRYRPSAVEAHFIGLKRPIVTEALATCPQQFLYQMVSRITGNLCVVPYSAL